jgi:hypothetical protein
MQKKNAKTQNLAKKVVVGKFFFVDFVSPYIYVVKSKMHVFSGFYIAHMDFGHF